MNAQDKMPRWQRAMPQCVGRFWVATRQGEIAGILSVVDGRANPIGGFFCADHQRTDGSGTIFPGTSWSGFWWPVPIEEPPPCIPEEAQ